jgi:Ca2+-binding RTX toxin-like protein
MSRHRTTLTALAPAAIAALLALVLAPPLVAAAQDAGADCGEGTVVHGTAGDDQLTGTPGDDVIYGHDGDDTIDGQGGDDTIVGGDGQDEIRGGGGEDCLDGGKGHDSMPDKGAGDTTLRVEH